MTGGSVEPRQVLHLANKLLMRHLALGSNADLLLASEVEEEPGWEQAAHE